MASTKVEHLPLNFFLGDVLDLVSYTTPQLSTYAGKILQRQTAGYRHTRYLKGQHILHTCYWEQNWTKLCKWPEAVNIFAIQSDPKNLLHCQTYPGHLFAVKGSNLHQHLRMPCDSLAICGTAYGTLQSHTTRSGYKASKVNNCRHLNSVSWPMLRKAASTQRNL